MLDRTARPLRGATAKAAFAYAAAFALTFVSTSGMVLIVGTWRAAGEARLVEGEARRFAMSPSGLMACAFIEAVVLVALSLAAGQRENTTGTRLSALSLGPGRESGLGTAAAAIGLVGLSAAGGAVLELIRSHGPRVGGIDETFAAAFGGAGPSRVVLALLCVGLLPAVAEEVFFRGFLQTMLEPRWGRGPAIVASATAFAFFHFDWAQGAVAFFAGLLLGWTAERFGSIRPCIAAHATNNALFVALAALSPTWANLPQVQPWVLACGVVVFSVAVAALKRPMALRIEKPPALAPLSEDAGDPYDNT